MQLKTNKQKVHRDLSTRKPVVSLLHLCPWWQTMGIPSPGPLWLSASPATEAVLSAWDVAVLQGQKITLQSASWQDEVGSEGSCKPLSAP